MRRELERFDPALPIERAPTPPASWYTDPAFLRLETAGVFRRTWQPVARRDELSSPGDFVSGDLAGEPFVVLRDGGRLRAFFNVCRHHASCIVAGSGNVERLRCPYHGWTYDLDGRLRKAPRLGAVRGFDREQFSLVPLAVESWGPLVFVRIEGGGPPLADSLAPLAGRIDCASLRFVRRVRYEIACNWKVFVDNYLDGGYHVGELHKGLASLLDLDTYRTEIAGGVSLQVCAADPASAGGEDFKERVGRGAVYAFVYPNFMINRYGPIMDTNWVLPLGHDRTLTVFDFYFEAQAVERDPSLVERSIAASDRVQREDVEICESVQRGLRSSSYDTGRYAPDVEQAAYHFHGLLARDLRAALDGEAGRSLG
jgi:choline monooxygenase